VARGRMFKRDRKRKISLMRQLMKKRMARRKKEKE
jgi:hypothetical protein